MKGKDNPGTAPSTGNTKRGGVDDMKVEQLLKKERNRGKRPIDEKE